MLTVYYCTILDAKLVCHFVTYFIFCGLIWITTNYINGAVLDRKHSYVLFVINANVRIKTMTYNFAKIFVFLQFHKDSAD